MNFGLTLPSPRVCALLVLVFLGFGVIIGGAAGSRADDTLAASTRPPLKLILPPAAPVSATPGLASSPPSAQAEATPSPSAEPPPASEPAAAGEGSSNESSTKTSIGKSKKSSPAPGSTPAKSGAGSKLPPVKHVFVIMLSDEPYASAFGPSSVARYLTGTLEAKGELLVRYYAVAHEQLANGIALLSGQGPTPQTAQNCPTYEDLTPGTAGTDGQASGKGCVYPSTTQTLAGQLTAKHLTWRAYAEGMGEGSGQAIACGHPNLGAPDPTASLAPPAGQAYATFRNPFVYFHSVTGSPACKANDVGLSRLKTDLKSAKSTPSFSYIVPGRCHDGNTTPCAAGAGAGMGPADSFLARVVPAILSSKGYKEGGLLVITTDEAPSTGEFADSSSCCGQPGFPNLPPPAGGLGLAPKGGGQVGALLLSSFVKPHTTSQEPYNHFSLLRTIEDLFGLTHLGYAGLPKVSSFEPPVFSAYTPR
ncbi:MAG TPA: alkaline phosphatase family protein [Solirubrobacteraceae bacterium]|nr:alkaline phosphatase family protein [Solirubrobacteraceae bacterium]